MRPTFSCGNAGLARSFQCQAAREVAGCLVPLGPVVLIHSSSLVPVGRELAATCWRTVTACDSLLSHRLVPRWFPAPRLARLPPIFHVMVGVTLLLPLKSKSACVPPAKSQYPCFVLGTNPDSKGVVMSYHRFGISDRKASSLWSSYGVLPKFLKMLLTFCEEGG